MATMTFNGKTIPVNINLVIEPGANPGSILRLGDGKSSVDLKLTYAELYKMVSGLKGDVRFGLGIAPGNDQMKVAKEAMDRAKEQMDGFAKDFGL